MSSAGFDAVLRPVAWKPRPRGLDSVRLSTLAARSGTTLVALVTDQRRAATDAEDAAHLFPSADARLRVTGWEWVWRDGELAGVRPRVRTERLRGAMPGQEWELRLEQHSPAALAAFPSDLAAGDEARSGADLWVGRAGDAAGGAGHAGAPYESNVHRVSGNRPGGCPPTDHLCLAAALPLGSGGARAAGPAGAASRSVRPDAPAAPADYAQAIEPVLAVLGTLSPTVEWSTDPARMAAAARHDRAARYAVFLDGTGLSALYGSEVRLAQLIGRDVLEQMGHRAQLGIADGRFAALRAAVAPGVGAVMIVPPGGDAAFLARLPVSMLPLPPEACTRLTSLGARTLHEFSRLPANALWHRFGPDGIVALALAAGHDEGPLRARTLPLQLHDALDLEWVETSLDRLLFLFKRLADRLSVRLEHHGLGCGRLRVRWLLDASGLATGDDMVDSAPNERALSATDAAAGVTGGADDGSVVSTVRLSEPAGSGASLLEHLRWRVEGLRPKMFRDPISGQLRGVRGIVVEAEELASLGGRQLALLPGEDGRAAEPKRLLAAERALARLQARWGDAAVQQAELVASRRPERAFRWRETMIHVSTAALGKHSSPGRGKGGRSGAMNRAHVRRAHGSLPPFPLVGKGGCFLG